MLRKRMAGMCLLATLVLGATLSNASTAQAQVIDLDDEEGDGAAASSSGGAAKGGAKAGKDGKAQPAEQPAVVAGQMTEDAAAAKSLFDKQKWAEAALALHRVVAGETG